jgi:hypothetical protein
MFDFPGMAKFTTKTFPIINYGGKEESLKAAIAWREEMRLKLPKQIWGPMHLREIADERDY